MRLTSLRRSSFYKVIRLNIYKLIVLAFVININTLGLCQSRKDYVVTIKGDTLFGKVKATSLSILLKMDDGSKKTFNKHNDLKGFRKEYEDYLYKEYTKRKQSKYIKLKIIDTGKLNLYSQEVKNQNGTRQVVYYVEYENGQLDRITNKYYWDVLVPFLKQCSGFSKRDLQLMQTSGPRALTSFILTYNLVCDD